MQSLAVGEGIKRNDGKIERMAGPDQRTMAGLKFTEKLIAIFSVISVIGVAATMYYLNTSPEYGVLFTDLSEADAGAITNDLTDQKIDYKLTDNGTTILIAKEQIDEYRIELAVENKLPNTATGFELLMMLA